MSLRMPGPWKHPKTGVYYVRQRVPADLASVVGSRMLQYSLGTKDPVKAKALHAEEQAKIEKRWQALRAQPEPLPHREIMGLTGELYTRLMALRVDEPGEPEVWIEFLRVLESLDGDASAMERWYGPTADALLQERGVATDEPSRARLIREAHGASQQAGLRLLKQARGDYSPDPDADRFPKLTKGTRKATKGVTIGDLFDLWERDHLADGKSERTPRDHRQKVDDFITFLKHDDAKRVTPKDVSDWTEHLRHGRSLAAKTVADKYLSAVRAVFGAGVAKFRIESNPATIRVKVPKRKAEREKGFTDGEAKLILTAALAAPDAPGETSAENRLAFRWLPWICAYTGARAGEIAQLRKDDFTTEAGVRCIRITPEAGTVKTGQYRVVPVHPHLIEQGLLKVAGGSKGGPLFYKPSGRERKAGTSQAGYVVGKVSKWVREVAKVTDKRVQPNHGWRHRFKTVARDVGIEQRYMDVIQGHADGSSSAEYGDNTVKALAREIRKMPRYKVEARGTAARKRG